MKKIALAIACTFVFMFTVFTISAEAHPLSCDYARKMAGHPNAFCDKTSENHAWLWFPWRICEEHMYWSHPQPGWHIEYEVHCSTWH